MENVQESNAEITNKPGLVMEARFASEATNMEREDCSTSDVTNQESGSSSRRLRRSRNHASGLMRSRKRWRGRVENLNCTNGESYTGTSEDATADKVCLNKILNLVHCDCLFHLFSTLFKKIYRIWKSERMETMR